MENRINFDTTRPMQCLRHHVWMAACPDCHDARIARRRSTSGH
jgi:hypothetical protein